jgi:DNA-binding Xre family transcriptional regulator
MLRLQLRKILRDRGLTQKVFSEMTGLSRNAISTLSHNPSQIRISTLDALCKTLDLTPDDLFVEDEE